MTTARLNGWQRLWLAYSAVTLLCVWGVRDQLYPTAKGIEYSVYQDTERASSCLNYFERTDIARPVNCGATSKQQAQQFFDASLASLNEASKALAAENTDWWIITLAVWVTLSVVGWGVVQIGRWIIRGFRPKVSR
jgi:hypothetical protein